MFEQLWKIDYFNENIKTKSFDFVCLLEVFFQLGLEVLFQPRGDLRGWSYLLMFENDYLEKGKKVKGSPEILQL